MKTLHLGSAVVAAGVVAAGFSTGTAWASGPEGGAPNDLFEAVGSGTFDDTRTVRAVPAPKSASARRGHRRPGVGGGGRGMSGRRGVDCTSDEVTNDNLCIVSVFDPAPTSTPAAPDRPSGGTSGRDPARRGQQHPDVARGRGPHLGVPLTRDPRCNPVKKVNKTRNIKACQHSWSSAVS